MLHVWIEALSVSSGAAFTVELTATPQLSLHFALRLIAGRTQQMVFGVTRHRPRGRKHQERLVSSFLENLVLLRGRYVSFGSNSHSKAK